MIYKICDLFKVQKDWLQKGNGDPPGGVISTSTTNHKRIASVENGNLELSDGNLIKVISLLRDKKKEELAIVISKELGITIEEAWLSLAKAIFRKE